MRSKSYCINIAPITWQRVARKTSRSYDTVARSNLSFELYLAQQHNDEAPFKKPVHLDIIFYMPLSKTLKCKNNYHSTVPSLDDLYKFVVESLKKTIVAEERLICSLSVKKVYDKEPRTELIITEVA